MEHKDHIISHDQFAASYDESVKEYNSYGHEILFGMCYEFVRPGETLLDLGIGTGLSSVHFARVGLKVFGLDESGEMLKECEKKGFAQDLRQVDIRDVPLPFDDGGFSHVISCGVFHFAGDWTPTIGEACRIVQSGGIFAFTVASATEQEAARAGGAASGYIKLLSSWGVPIFKHTDAWVQKTADRYGLEILKEQKVLAESGDDKSEDILFKVYVTRKQGGR